MSKRHGVLTSIHLLCRVSFAQKFFVFGSLAHRLSKHLVASQYVGNEPWKVCQNHGSSLQGPGPISILSGQHVSLLVVDAGDGGTEVVGAEGLDGHLLDDMLELRGGHLDLVDLAILLLRGVWAEATAVGLLWGLCGGRDGERAARLDARAALEAPNASVFTPQGSRKGGWSSKTKIRCLGGRPGASHFH